MWDGMVYLDLVCRLVCGGVACGMFEWFGLGSLVVLVVAFDFFVTYCLGLGLAICVSGYDELGLDLVNLVSWGLYGTGFEDGFGVLVIWVLSE